MVDIKIPQRYIHIEPCQMTDARFLEGVLKNPRIPHDQKSKLFPVYLDLRISAILAYDKKAYPPSDRLYRGTPSYLPDHYRYMGPDPEKNPAKRRGEMVVIDKREVLARSHHLFWQVFGEGEVSGRRKVEIIADDIEWTLNSESKEGQPRKRVSNLHDYIGIRNAQCRHRALYAQVMFQTFGVESRYLPADIICEDSGITVGHACNLVQIDDEWYLLSSNRPSRVRGADVPVSDRLFLSPVPDKRIDINTKTYIWRPDFWVNTLIRTRQRAFFQIR